MCQRYFQKSYDVTDKPGTVTYTNSVHWFPDATTLWAGTTIGLPVQMRTQPSCTVYSPVDGATGYLVNGGSNKSCYSSSAISNLLLSSWAVSISQSSDCYAHYTLSSEL